MRTTLLAAVTLLSVFSFHAASLTAAVLKWLETTTRRAMIVVSNDGLTGWSSPPLLKSGVYFKARQQTTPLPAASLATQGPKGRCA
jgi:hypothetical protein